MENMTFTLDAPRAAAGNKQHVIVGVVASGDLEVLLERVQDTQRCEVSVATPIRGFDTLWKYVIEDFVARRSAGGLRVSINDGGARPDTVALRLAQAVRLIEEDSN